MDWLRANIGVCPQHDVLWDELTAKEHVVLFGAMRGLTTDTDPDLVSNSLRGVDLLGKADELVRHLLSKVVTHPVLHT